MEKPLKNEQTFDVMQAACDYLTNRGVETWGGAGIKDETTVDLAIERGVTLITCNNPDVVLELLRQKGKRILK